MKYSKPNPTQTHFCTINPDYLHAQTVDTYYLPYSDDINCFNGLFLFFFPTLSVAQWLTLLLHYLNWL